MVGRPEGDREMSKRAKMGEKVRKNIEKCFDKDIGYIDWFFLEF